MLKKIVLVALFVASTTIAAGGTVFAHQAQQAPLPKPPQSFCPMGFCV